MMERALDGEGIPRVVEKVKSLSQSFVRTDVKLEKKIVHSKCGSEGKMREERLGRWRVSLEETKQCSRSLKRPCKEAGPNE